MFGSLHLTKAHASKNDIFLVDLDLAKVQPSAGELRALIINLCDRAGPLGADGVYFVSSEDRQAHFFNPDGNNAEICGNGLRCVARYLMERREERAVVIPVGQTEVPARLLEAPWAPDVPGVEVILPAGSVRLSVPGVPAADDGYFNEFIPELSRRYTFTGAVMPNPHLVTFVDEFSEGDLVALGQAVESNPGVLPAGANVSMAMPLPDGQLFVGTYERGAGLTASCGSAVAATRLIFARRTDGALDELLIRSPGGFSRVGLLPSGSRLRPVMQGNATFVFTAEVYGDDLAAGRLTWVEGAARTQELRAYTLIDDANTAVLRGLGIQSSLLSSPVAATH